MAVKTITIDLEAYETLARRKKPGQSFSQVIKEHFGPVKKGRDLRETVRAIRISTETLDAIDRLEKGRQADETRAPEL